LTGKRTWLRQTVLIFNVLQRRDPDIFPGMALAQSVNEAPVAESFNDPAVCA